MKQLQKFQLLFVSSSFGLSMLATYMMGFILGLTLMIAVLIATIFYVNKRQANVLGSLGFRDSGIGNNERPFSYGSSGKLRYVCLSCGTKVSGRTCRKCGSHMKKVVF